MSATNRGAIRNERDFYATPEWAFAPIVPMLPHDVNFWEPACGDGRLVRMLSESGRSAAGADLLPHGYAEGFQVGNFLEDTTRREFIITNPPFSLAFDFVRHAANLAPEVLMLLRLNFLGAVSRAEWFRAHEPSALFMITPRPSFTNGGGTDSCEYAWIYWGTRFQGIHHPKFQKP
jgi:hypothetical protein